jgi:hypothetical protein
LPNDYTPGPTYQVIPSKVYMPENEFWSSGTDFEIFTENADSDDRYIPLIHQLFSEGLLHSCFNF